MKKITLLFVMAAISLSAAANRWYAGGSFGFWRNSTENVTTFNIMPEIGYNLNSKLAVAMTFGYGHEYNDGLSLDLGCIKPYVSYTIFTSGKVSIFADGCVDLGFGSSKSKGHKSDTAFTYGIGLRPGISYRISDKFSISSHFAYLGYEGGNDASGAPSQGGFGLNLNEINFAAYYNF